MRLFVAINFNNETRARLLALRDELSAKSERGNYSAQENLHLTLAFLGECDEKQGADARAAMEASSFGQFPVHVDRIGRFKRNGGDIWWAGLQESEQLIRLQQDLTDNLTEAGFALKRRKYSPHVTLGREVVTVAKPWDIEPFGEMVSAIDLMKSERIRGKLTYSSIFRRENSPVANWRINEDQSISIFQGRLYPSHEDSDEVKKH
ncbi:MAG: RNA 2',3'-cyclic phosphodiesterase [Oscillospiraceae bacterium]|nr:RNA 2',3'-cyclic phosphodiesterase [Oscillospiraceae bacterium]